MLKRVLAMAALLFTIAMLKDHGHGIRLSTATSAVP